MLSECLELRKTAGLISRRCRSMLLCQNHIESAQLQGRIVAVYVADVFRFARTLGLLYLGQELWQMVSSQALCLSGKYPKSQSSLICKSSRSFWATG